MDEVNTPDVADGGPAKRDMKAIKAAAAERSGGKPAAKSPVPSAAAARARSKATVAKEQAIAPTPDNDIPEELVKHAVAQTAAKPGQRWIVYRGQRETHICYRTTAPLLFQEQAWSNGWQVALVDIGFGQNLVDTSVLKTYGDGSQRRPEDWEDMYVWFDDVSDKRPVSNRRKNAKV